MMIIALSFLAFATLVASFGCCLVKGKKCSILLQILALVSVSCFAIFASFFSLGALSNYAISLAIAILLFSPAVVLPKSKNDHLFSILLILGAFMLGFSGFYLGLEVAHGFILAILATGAVIFVLLARKKKFTLLKWLEIATCLLSGFILLGQILPVMLYSTSLANILYCIGSVVFATYCFLRTKFNKTWLLPLLHASLFIFACTLFF